MYRAFHTENTCMFRIVSGASSDALSPHFEKHVCGIDLYRADSGTELAEAAFKGHPLMGLVRRII